MKTNLHSSHDGGHEIHSAAARGRTLMFLSVAFFTANALLVRLLGGHYGINTWVIACSRFAAGFVAVALLARTGYAGGRLSYRALVWNPWLVARGIIGSLGVCTYYLAVTEGGAGRATFISTLYIPLGAVFAALLLREELSPRTIAALFLGLVGVALLTGFPTSGGLAHPGDSWAVLTAIGSAIVIVLIRRLHQRETTSTIFAAQCGWGLLFAVIPAVQHFHPLSAPAAFLLLVAAGASLCGQLALTRAFRALPVAEGALIQLLVPLGIALGGVGFFGETYHPVEAWGTGLLLLSCIISAQLRPRLTAGLPGPETK